MFKAIDPFDWIGTKSLLGLPKWANISFGVLFIILGIIIICFYFPKARDNAKNYKKKQLEKWRELNPKRTLTPYGNTGLFLPPWEKTKMMLPSFLGIVFIILGIAWIVGSTLTSL